MLALLIGLVAIAVAVGVYQLTKSSRPIPDPPDPDSATLALPAAVPYEFVWLPGATRGVDLPHEIYIKSIGKRLPLTSVGDLRSVEGEGKVAFLQRVRHAMVAYSDRQTYEACALICAGENGFSVRMTSVGAVTQCAVAPVCMSGHASLMETIHSHCPKRPALRATMADEFLSGRALKRNRPFGRCDPENFSSRDFAGWRPGWLAGINALYRHDGPQSIKAYE